MEWDWRSGFPEWFVILVVTNGTLKPSVPLGGEDSTLGVKFCCAFTTVILMVGEDQLIPPIKSEQNKIAPRYGLVQISQLKGTTVEGGTPRLWFQYWV